MKDYSIGTALIDSPPLSYSERSAPSALQQYYYMAQWPRSTHTLTAVFGNVLSQIKIRSNLYIRERAAC